MEGEYLCKCNNCGSVMYDENPCPTRQSKVDLGSIKQEVLPMELLNEDGESFYGCGTCQTDNYLTDI